MTRAPRQYNYYKPTLSLLDTKKEMHHIILKDCAASVATVMIVSRLSETLSSQSHSQGGMSTQRPRA